MEIKSKPTSGLKKIAESYQKPTPKKWRRIGDFALLLCIAIQPSIDAMPLQDIQLKEWLVWGFSTFLILFKFYTNTRV